MNVLDEIKLLITANADGAIAVISGFTATTTSELASVEGTAAASGAKAGGLFASNFAGGATTGLATLAGTFAALGEAFFAKSAISSAIDYERATAAVNATLKATSGISGATAGGIDRLSASLEKSQAIFAGTIKQGAALLLTFTDVQNQPGPGKDIFDRALTTATALSNVRGIPLETAVTQIGRVLENPQSGSQALQRSGVTLAQQDKQRIIDLAKQGDLIGSQKALLDAIANKGIIQQGAAIAAADPAQRFSVAYKDLKKTVGEDLLPAATILLGIFEDAFRAVEKIPAPLRNVVELLALAGAAVIPLKKLNDVFNSINAIGKNRVGAGPAVNEGAANLDAAGTKAGAAISSAAADLAAAGEKSAEAIKAASLTTGSETGAASGEAGTVAATKIDESAANVGEAGTLAGARIDEGAVALDGAAATLFKQINAGAVSLIEAGDVFAAKMLAVAEEQAAAQSALTGVGPVAVSESTKTIAVDSAGEATVIGINEGVANLDAAGAKVGADIESGAGALTDAGAKVGADIESGAGALTDAGASIGAEIDAASAALAEAGALAASRIAAANAVGGGGLLGSPGVGGPGGLSAGEEAAVGGGLFGLGKGSKLLGSGSFLGGEATLSLGTAAVGALTFYESYKHMSDFIGADHHTWAQLSKDVEGFANEIKHADTDNFAQKFANFGQTKADFKSANAGLTEILDTQGPEKAALAYNDFRIKLQAFGITGEDLAARFHPFITALYDSMKAEAAAKAQTSDLVSEYGRLAQSLEGVKSELAVKQDFLNLHDAQKQLSDDQADLAGTGDKAKAALQGVADAEDRLAQDARTASDDQRALADAYVAVQDAQDRVTTSTHSLAEARAALALFNSPRGELERFYAADALNRRVVTTPAEEDQKQLDILQTQDANAAKQQQLEDAVTSAERAQRDAIKGVADAKQNVIDKNAKLHDDAKQQETDYRAVATAIDNVKKVHSDAAAQIEADQIKVQNAIIQTGIDINTDQGQIDQFGATWLKQLAAIADAVAPGSDLAKNLHKILNDYQNSLVVAAAAQKVAGTTGLIGPVGPVGPPTPYANPTADAWANAGQPPPGYQGYTQYPNKLDGGISFAAGGIEQHIAQIDKASKMRLWAEPETGGEAYIPLAGSKRGRSTSILMQVADHFGLKLVDTASGALSSPHFADGGTWSNMTMPGSAHYASGGLPPLPSSNKTPPSSAPFEQTVTQENHFYGKDTPSIADLDYANRELGWKLSRSGRR